MQRIWSTLFAIIGMILLLSEARPHSSADKASRYSDEIRELLDSLLNDRQHEVRYLQGTKARSQTYEKRSRKKTYTKEEIDNKKVDADSDLELLFESMSDNDHNAVGIHPDQKGNIKAMKLEEKHESTKHTKTRHRIKPASNTKRNFIPQIQTIEFDRYWPNATVPYYIDLTTFENQETVRTILRQTKEEFEAKTCVKLISKTADELEAEYLQFFVKITNTQDGCYSDLGMKVEYMNIGQILNLQESDCMYKSTAIHEFGHALGMAHEQSRQDRDKHVTINFDNIEEDNKYNLKKEVTLDKNPYDYYSVMQYRLKSFNTKSWENSMNFRDPELEFLAGASPGLSFYDVMDITKAYNCSSKCQSNITCKNAAFVNHMCNCYCPDGLIGDDCDTIASDGCGGIIDLVPGKQVNITSPNYPKNYDVGQTCYWLLRAQNKDQRVMIEFVDFDIANNKEMFRCYHWLEVRYNLVGQPGRKFCGDKFFQNKISSTEFGNPHLMMLIFDTSTVPEVQAAKGFSIIAEAFEVNPDGCGSEPPVVANAANDFVEVGRAIGAIVKYKCDEDYQPIGEHSFVTCEADGTWSDVRFRCKRTDPIFQCKFDEGDCGISSESDDSKKEWHVETETWTEPDENGVITSHDNSFFRPQPNVTYTEGFVLFILPKYLKVDITYCLSFFFRRTSDSDKCANMHVGQKYVYRWSYQECLKKDWVLFKGNFGPWDDVNVSRTKMSFTAEVVHEDGGEFNFDIDDITLIEGKC